MEERPHEDKKIFKIEKIETVDTSTKVDVTKMVEAEEIAPSRTKFDVALARADETAPMERVSQVKKSEETTLLSPIHEMRSKAVGALEPATQERILDKAATIHNTITTTSSTIESTLNQYPNLQLAPADTKELSKKLTHIDAAVKSSLNVVGVEATTAPPITPTEGKNPLTTFLGYLTHSDTQMKSLTREIEALGKDPTLSPGKLISIQIKMNFVQQEIDFFSSALNKALESAKTIMNVQI